MKTKARKLCELSRIELKDMFISIISGHDKEIEIAAILAVFTAIKLPMQSAIKNGVIECDTNEMIELIEQGVLCKIGGYDEEEKAWDIILDSLKPDEVMDIILDIDDYINRYNGFMLPLNDLKLSLLKNFVGLKTDNE